MVSCVSRAYRQAIAVSRSQPTLSTCRWCWATGLHLDRSTPTAGTSKWGSSISSRRNRPGPGSSSDSSPAACHSATSCRRSPGGRGRSKRFGRSPPLRAHVTLQLDPQSCRHLDLAIQREWLVTNGLGGYASGTVSGVNTRRYHGLLVAALNPPVQRMVLVAALEEWIRSDNGDMEALSAQEYWDGTVFPQGYRQLDGVELDGMLPVFRWTIDGRTIEKRIWMEQGVWRTAVTSRLVGGSPLALQLRPLFAHRDYHQQRHGQGAFETSETAEGWIIDAAGVRSHFGVRSAATVCSRPDWYWRVLHRAERERGLDDEEDLFTPGVVDVALAVGVDVAVVMGTEPTPHSWDSARSSRAA